jgi:predicted lactoylglutathione lyase
MKAKKIWANLAVSDLERTTRFYTDLGFALNNTHTSKELTSFIIGEENFVVHFFLKEVLQSNINGSLIDTKQGNEVIFSLSAESKEEVMAWVEKVRKAGGTISIEYKEIDKGCFCVFSDPDGHKYNVLFWP